MIIDKMDNIRLYGGLLNNLENGLLAVEALKNPECGRYEFDGGFFLVQKGDTKPMRESLYEVHQKYVDVQIVLEGSEEIAWAEISDLYPGGDYDPEKDKKALDGADEHVMKISEGMFYILFPHDAHKAGKHIKHRQSYTKIVMKLPVI